MQTSMTTARSDLPTVLLVDDEPAVLAALGRLLRGLPCKILSAANGLDAFHLLEANRHAIHLVISDMRMPEMNGLQLLSQIAGRFPAVRRILLTGYADLDTMISAINEGRIHFFLEKPWDDQQIRSLVEQELKSQQVVRENRRLQATVKKQNDMLLQMNRDLEQRIQDRTANLFQSQQALQDAKRALEETHNDTLDLLSKLISNRFAQASYDEDLLEAMAAQAGVALGLQEIRIGALKSACRLRNIGLLSLPERLQHQSLSRLSRQELRLFHSHPLVASGLLQSVAHLSQAAVIVEQHKEYLDGSGYPNRLRKSDICQEARILCAVSDLFDYRCGRVVPERLAFIEAFDMLQQKVDKRYDGQVLQVMGDILCSYSSEVASDGLHMSCDQLAPGMQIARDLRSRSGAMLLARGVVLDQNTIHRLQRLQTNMEEQFCVAIHLDA